MTRGVKRRELGTANRAHGLLERLFSALARGDHPLQCDASIGSRAHAFGGGREPAMQCFHALGVREVEIAVFDLERRDTEVTTRLREEGRARDHADRGKHCQHRAFRRSRIHEHSPLSIR